MDLLLAHYALKWMPVLLLALMLLPFHHHKDYAISYRLTYAFGDGYEVIYENFLADGNWPGEPQTAR